MREWVEIVKCTYQNNNFNKISLHSHSPPVIFLAGRETALLEPDFWGLGMPRLYQSDEIGPCFQERTVFRKSVLASHDRRFDPWSQVFCGARREDANVWTSSRSKGPHATLYGQVECTSKKGSHFLSLVEIIRKPIHIFEMC